MKAGKVQSLRGIACILLVVYHVVGATELQGLRIQGGWLRQLTEALTAVRMPVFGLIAGAMYGFSSKRGLALVRDKGKRLLIPMLTVGTLFAVVQSLVPHSNNRIEDWHLLHIVPVAHYWFLESLFWVFCLMVLAETFAPIRRFAPWLMYFAISVGVYLSHPGVIWFSILGTFYLLPYFLLGVGLTRLGWDCQQERRSLGLLLCALGMTLVALLMQHADALDRFSAPMLVSGLLLSAGLWSSGWNQRWLAWVGDHSFAIFLFHSFFTSAARMLMRKLQWDEPLAVLAVSVPLGLLAPVLLQQLAARSRLCRHYVLAMPALRRSAA